MPVAPYFNVLFAAGKEFWTYPKWQERTKFIVPPFVDDATPALTGLSGQEINAVKALSDRIHGTGVSYAERILKLEKLHDNDSDGLHAWDTWVRRDFVNWRVVRDIEDILTAEEIHPRQLIGTQGFGNTVPPAEAARTNETCSVIAEKLFGEDAFRDCHVVRPIVKEELKGLILAVVEFMWDKMREEITGQFEDAQRSKEKAHARFEELNNIDEGTKLEASNIERWHQVVVALSECWLCFSDDIELENELEKQMDRMNWVYQALTGDANPAMIEGLSENLRNALGDMVKGEDLGEDTEIVDTLFVELPRQLDWQEAYKDGPVELDLNPQEPVDWTEGVEHLKTKTENELYDMLGFDDRKIPFLVTEVDTESDFYTSAQTGTYEGDVFAPAMEPRATRRPFSLKWHQLVGVTKMVERALTSGPIMLMDDFGVGKMVQVLAFFAVMAYYRKFYSEAKQYPGIWGTQEWTNFTGEKATLPKSPFLIVVPPALVDQVAWECDHFLEKGSFDVIRYFGRYKTNQKVWEELRKPSSTGNPSHMRIYVASTTAVQSDSSYVHLPCIGTRNPRVKKVAGRDEVDTIFRQRYLCVAIDEAHAFRDPNKAYTAVRALRERTDMLVAMTWTPLQTRPSDLWHIGKVIGLSGFKDDVHTNEEFAGMQRELAEARQEDEKIQLEHEAESLGALHRTSRGEGECTISVGEKAVEQKFPKVKAQWMKVVHERYHGAVIRRTVNSLDYLGSPIYGLEPYEEHICMLELHEHEYKALGDIASYRKIRKSLRRLECELLYSFFQQCVLHPVFVHQMLEESQEKEQYETLGSYEGYRNVPSCKLDSLVEIINHHLAADDMPGIEPSRQRPLGAFLRPGAPPTQSPSPPSSPLHHQQQQNEALLAHQTPDKIVVCSYFVRSLILIQTVLNAHGIQAFVIDGRTGQQETIRILEEFKSSKRDGPRVLLISNMSSIGLNIAFANILIIVDVLRSVMSDQQLVGRVWCHPQRKRVHVYRLVGERSPDVFLNALSFTEGYITESFLKSDHRIREVLKDIISDDTILVETGAAEGERGEASSISDLKGKAGAVKKKGEKRDSKTTRPRSRITKKEKQTSGVAMPTASKPLQITRETRTGESVITEQDIASEGMRLLLLEEQVEPGAQAATGPSFATREIDGPGLFPIPKTAEDLPADVHSLKDGDDALPEPDTSFGPFDKMDVDAPEPSVSRKKISSGDREFSPSPRTRSITPSVASLASSTSAQSKHSRQTSDEEESGASSQKRRKETRCAAGVVVKAGDMPVRRGRSARSTPAQDSQFLTIEANSARLPSKQRQRSRCPEMIEDDSESIDELYQGDMSRH